METEALRRRVEAVDWYHEFDFGSGVRTQPCEESLRLIWAFIEYQLESIDFTGKTVLDIGCWDGYWSFHAEKQGAASVLATDDVSQNPSCGEGLQLARRLLNSSIDIDQDMSIYDLGSLNRTFDIILCLGVYYHLHAPLYALSQVRHCCHADTVVLLEGALGQNLGANAARYSFHNHASEFLPSTEVLHDMLAASYFTIERQAGFREFLCRSRLLPWRKRASLYARQLRSRWNPWAKAMADRVFVVCRPFAGVNPIYCYRPPFGLAAYDDRFRTATPSEAA